LAGCYLFGAEDLLESLLEVLHHLGFAAVARAGAVDA
jgi:hypothetical protein